MFCRPLVRQHRWPLHLPGRYATNTCPAVRPVALWDALSMPHWARHRIRPPWSSKQINTTSNIRIFELLFLSVLFLHRSATDTALRHWVTNLMFADGHLNLNRLWLFPDVQVFFIRGVRVWGQIVILLSTYTIEVLRGRSAVLLSMAVMNWGKWQ